MSDTTSKTSVRGIEVARLLLDIKAVNFRPEEPYMLTAGWASPVYIDCRWVVSFLDARRRIIKLAGEMLSENIDMSSVDMLAGGETAGIPYSSWLSEELSKPMLYVRKKPKGFGRNAQIEGSMSEGAKSSWLRTWQRTVDRRSISSKHCAVQVPTSKISLLYSSMVPFRVLKKPSATWAFACMP